MEFILFFKNLVANLGFLTLPIFIVFSLVFVITIERTIFYLFVWKNQKAMNGIKDVIINNKSYPKQLREDLISVEIENINSSLTFGLGSLKFLASLATMLGLLGTVIGMINVFSSIAEVKTAVSPNMISGGIKLAMFTTAYGLAIAIFAIFACYIFEVISSKILFKIQEYSTILNATVEYERLTEISKKSHTT